MPRVDLPFVVAGYSLVGLLGFGGTGEVWRAVDDATGQPVALKRLWEPASAELVSRLRREAAMLEAVAGRHAVAIHEVRLLVDNEVVLVMEYAAGGSLASLLARRSRLAPAEVITVLAPLAGVLGVAQQQALRHGDLTPTNIVFAADGCPKLCDFGLALTTGERAADDPAYRDPALSAGWASGPASDVFGLAAIGYAALTGVPPRPADVMGRVPAIAELVPTVPPALASAVEAAMSPDPDLRPDAATFADLVLRSCTAKPVRLGEPRPAAASDRGRSRRGRRSGRQLALTTVVFGSVGLSALTGVGWARLGPRPAVAEQPSAVIATPLFPTPVETPADAATPTTPAASKEPEWPRIVAHLDFLRAQAWLAGDPTLLAQVYEPNATGVDLDRASLGILAARGLRTRGFAITVEQAAAISLANGVAKLRVVDRLSDYSVVDRDGRVVSDQPGRVQKYLLTIARHGRRWLVRAIAAAG